MYTCCVERINYEDFLESEFSCMHTHTHTMATQQKSHGNWTVVMHQNNNTTFRIDPKNNSIHPANTDVMFVAECSLPDTLNSWFLVVQLHVW